MKKIEHEQWVVAGGLVALSIIGAQFNVFSSIAFDSLPGFLGAVLIHPLLGGLVGLVGHMMTALFSGFPMSIPVHLITALMMFGSCAVYGYGYRRWHAAIGIILGIVLNGPIALGIAALYMQLALNIPFYGTFFGLLIPLTLAAGVNAVGAAAVYRYIPIFMKGRMRAW